MLQAPPLSHRRRAVTGGTALLVALATAAALGAGWAGPPRSAMVCTSTSTPSDAERMQLSEAHYLAMPAHGPAAARATAVVGAVYQVTDFRYDADNNAGTQVDEVHILQGQSVQFQWVSGIHTVTSGVNDDPDAGLLFDSPVDINHKIVTIDFPDAGTYPFHCLFHGSLSNMTGTIVVDAATPTRSTSWGSLKQQYR